MQESPRRIMFRPPYGIMLCVTGRYNDLRKLIRSPTLKMVNEAGDRFWLEETRTEGPTLHARS